MTDFKHTPVLLKETIQELRIREGSKYIDATFGGGGHAFQILEEGGILLGIDQDPDAIQFAEEKIKNQSSTIKNNLILVQGNFGDIGEIASKNGFEKVEGVLFDLGFSSYQIEQSGRGFSFMRNEPLDMRMSSRAQEDIPGVGVTAREIVNTYSQEELYNIFSRFGEEQNSERIARAIVEARREKAIETTQELSDVIKRVSTLGPIHPSTRVFQALRIVVNNELENLKKGLQQAFELLEARGRMAVISFHSLEDRIVKNYFRDKAKDGYATLVSKKPITASTEEVRNNPRSRSAKLRVIEKN